jgi:hypothetical protein
MTMDVALRPANGLANVNKYGLDVEDVKKHLANPLIHPTIKRHLLLKSF